MEVPRLGVELELQLQACATATATRGPSSICDLHHSSGQCRVLNPLSEARDRTHNLMVPSWIHFCYAKRGTPRNVILFDTEVFPYYIAYAVYSYSLNWNALNSDVPLGFTY